MKSIDFDLRINGTLVCNLDELRDNFTTEILELHASGVLLKWLKNKNLITEADKLSAITSDCSAIEMLVALCEIFCVGAGLDPTDKRNRLYLGQDDYQNFVRNMIFDDDDQHNRIEIVFCKKIHMRFTNNLPVDVTVALRSGYKFVLIGQANSNEFTIHTSFTSKDSLAIVEAEISLGVLRQAGGTVYWREPDLVVSLNTLDETPSHPYLKESVTGAFWNTQYLSHFVSDDGERVVDLNLLGDGYTIFENKLCIALESSPRIGAKHGISELFKSSF